MINDLNTNAVPNIFKQPSVNSREIRVRTDVYLETDPQMSPTPW